MATILLTTALAGCGGSSSSDSSKDRSPLDGAKIVAQARYSGAFSSDRAGDFRDNKNYLYSSTGCFLHWRETKADIYSNGYIYATTSLKDTIASNICLVTGVYKNIMAVDAEYLDIDYIGKKQSSYSLFYDKKSKQFYTIDKFEVKSGSKIISIKNGGMSATIKQPDGIVNIEKIIETYIKVPSEEVGVTLHLPQSPFFTGNKSDVMEVGYTKDVTDRPYNLKGGYLYKYRHSGCDLSIDGPKYGGSVYVIYNDGFMETFGIERNSESYCKITNFYEQVHPNMNSIINASYVNGSSSDSLYYDSNTGIYYEIYGVPESIKTESIKEIANDGYSAIIDGKVFYILEAYREVF